MNNTRTVNLAVSEEPSGNRDNSEATGKRAYLAGVIDADGSIPVSIHERPTCTGPSKRYALTVEVAVCSEPMARWLHENFGGTLRSQRSRTDREYWHWRVFNDEAVAVLKLAYPFLVEKKRQAALAFKFRELVKRTAWQRGSHRERLRDALVQEMRSLNYRPRPGAVETVREAPDNGVMIQSELRGDAQEPLATAAQ